MNGLMTNANIKALSNRVCRQVFKCVFIQ